MDEESLKFVIVGHIDHGKSTLIGRMLYDTNSLPEGKIEEIREICRNLGKEIEFGYVMDHLEEERDQGITIDTAQTFFNTEKRSYVIIDAPGHVEFLRNMITGASQAEAAILIIDAEEGIKEQTKRHAYILSMLGINQVIVAINKMDIMEYDRLRFEEIMGGICKFLDNINIRPKYIVPISSKEGDFIAKRSSNIGWYTGPTILEALDALEPRKSSKDLPLRFVVQDVYNFDKRIAVGRVEAGIIRSGDKIMVLPSGEETQVHTIEEYQRVPKEAEAGKSIGITTKDKLFIDRGNVITQLSDMPVVTDVVRANVFWMGRAPLREGESTWFRCSTQEVACKIEKIHRVINSSTLEFFEDQVKEIRAKEVGDITIRTDTPVVVEEFIKAQPLGRFVLGKDEIKAGGIITGLIQ